MINNISFVICTLNEELTVNKCLGSLAKMAMSNCEIICVDSGSTDKTLSVVKSYRLRFENFKVFCVNNYSNAAIARNVGIRNACKKYVFFVDGDVELCEDFIIIGTHALDERCDAVVGILIDYRYDCYHSKVEKIIKRDNIVQESEILTTGGTFFARKEVINKIGFFDEKFERSQDLEFALRLTRKFNLLALPVTMGTHHTICYEKAVRIKKSLARAYYCYLGMIIRRNIFNLRGLRYYFKKDIVGIISGLTAMLLMVIIFLVVRQPDSYMVIAILLLADILYGLRQKKSIFYRLILHYIAPLCLVVGILFDVDLRKKYTVSQVI